MGRPKKYHNSGYGRSVAAVYQDHKPKLAPEPNTHKRDLEEIRKERGHLRIRIKRLLQRREGLLRAKDIARELYAARSAPDIKFPAFYQRVSKVLREGEEFERVEGGFKLV